MRVLIKNGVVANANGQAKQDLLIGSETARQLGTDISPQLSCEEIGASGRYVLPDGMDVHTYFDIDVDIARNCNNFFAGTRAAACGGTTTIINHMGFGPDGCWLCHQLEVRRGYAAHKAVIDYSFHGVVQHINHAILNEIPMMVEEGLSSSKLYLTYQYKLNDDEALQALRHLHESGALTVVHPESDVAIASKRAELIVVGLTMPRYHALSRPLEYEVEAIACMTNLAQIAGNAPFYIVYLSNGLGLDYLYLACANHQPIWAEACSQYLLLDERSYSVEDGMKFILNPPLRNVREQNKLWYGISDGVIDVVTTDHCTLLTAQRLQVSEDDFSHCLDGLSGMENRMQLLFSNDVMTGRISSECFIELTSTMSVRLFSLQSQKGLLVPGSDGDVVTIDPRQSQRVQYHHLHDNADYSPWEGLTCQDVIARTLSHGETIFCDGTFTGRVG